MKKILSLIALSAVVMGSMAQTATSATKAAQPSEISKCMANFPASSLVSSSSEQEHDKLDSVNYLNTKTYEFPYNSKKEKLQVDELVASLIKAYDADLPHHTGGYCWTGVLRTDSPVKSKEVGMYYGENLAPLTIGGMGRNYVVLRTNYEQNPDYRHIKGVEWWLEPGSKNTATVCMKAFTLSGPQSSVHYLNALRQSDNAKVASEAKSKLEGLPEVSFSTREELLNSIKLLQQIYKNDGGAIDRAVVKSVNERIMAYLRLEVATDRDDMIRLFRVLGQISIPGYYCLVTNFNDGNMTVPFSEMEKIYDKLQIFCVDYGGTREVETDSQETPNVNFLLHFQVENEKLPGLGY